METITLTSIKLKGLLEHASHGYPKKKKKNMHLKFISVKASDIRL